MQLVSVEVLLMKNLLMVESLAEVISVSAILCDSREALTFVTIHTMNPFSSILYEPTVFVLSNIFPE